MRYTFEWDPTKAKQNFQKHGVSFPRAGTIFRDPYAISIFDGKHSQEEERWVTMGKDVSGILLVVCHTFRETDMSSCSIRIISARKATKTEKRQYEERNS